MGLTPNFHLRAARIQCSTLHVSRKKGNTKHVLDDKLDNRLPGRAIFFYIKKNQIFLTNS